MHRRWYLKIESSCKTESKSLSNINLIHRYTLHHYTTNYQQKTLNHAINCNWPSMPAICLSNVLLYNNHMLRCYKHTKSFRFEPKSSTAVTTTISERCFANWAVYHVISYGMQLKFSLCRGLLCTVADKGKHVQSCSKLCEITR